ncbi:MAG TPA: FG-GAP-like repeat-containing protein, partial [Geobacterales bacterium]|nr:FG-GAP-like repeat-containing protein [Geobacterales bacterium]
VGQNVAAGGTAELSFTVQNLAASPVDVTLSASDTAGWGAAIQGGTTTTIAANGNISVPVRVSVAGGATPGQTSNVTLTADDGITPKSVSSLLTVVSVDLNLSSDPLPFGSILSGSSSSQTITITNNSATAVKFGTVGGSNPLAAPFTKSSDSCSGATVAASGSCSFDITFNPSSNGVYNDSLDIPVLEPIIVTRTLTVSGTGFTLAPAGPHIVWRNATTGQNSVWTMDGTTFKSSAFINSAPAPWKVVGVGDLDADGSPDLIWRNPTTGQNSVWFMDGAAFKSTSSLTTVSASWSVVGVGDLNADGKADLIWRNPTTGQNSAWIMNGATISSSVYLSSAPAPWTVVGVGDLNADGKADLIWRNASTGQNSAWIMNGTTISSSVFLTSAPAPWTVVGVGDLNADGKADLIWRNATTGQNSVWLMNGTTVSSSVFLTSAAAPATVVGVADFNNDNKADILWRNPTTGQDTLWIMNGATTSSTVTLGSAPGAWSIIGLLKVPGAV